jgi:hypothetical protein
MSTRSTRLRRAAVCALLATVAMVAGCSDGSGETATIHGLPTPSAASTTIAPPTLPVPDLAAPVEITGVAGWWSWAAMDTTTGQMVGSANWHETTYPVSMAKAWIAADYLRVNYPDGKEPPAQTLASLETMILDSANAPADAFWTALGGRNTTDRMKSLCGVTDLVVVPNAWSATGWSARDAVRIGACIADGRAAGRWTSWLLDKMRHVRGEGNFGPRKIFTDPTTVATKNGWHLVNGLYYINCLAIGENWVIAVEHRWAAGSWAQAMSEGDNLCQTVARAILHNADDLVQP